VEDVVCRICANMKQDSHLAVGHAVEIIGKVDGNLNIKVQAATDFGTEIGMFSSSPFFWLAFVARECFVDGSLQISKPQTQL
jgi:replication factor A3